MPGGPGRGRGWGHGRRRRRRVMSFLQPCLLQILRQGEAHGYSLVGELGGFGFRSERLDPSLVYRALRDMEDAGWVSSRLSDDSQGPQRRVYQLTEAGREYLEAWVEDLRRVQQEIDLLLKAYEKQRG